MLEINSSAFKRLSLLSGAVVTLLLLVGAGWLVYTLESANTKNMAVQSCTEVSLLKYTQSDNSAYTQMNREIYTNCLAAKGY